MDLLLESPYPLAIVALCVAVSGVAIRQQGRRRGGTAVLAAGLLLLPSGWIVDGAVETDGEQIAALVRGLVADFKAGDRRAVIDAISSSEADLRELASRVMDLATFDDERLTGIRADVSGDRATADFRLNADFTIREGAIGTGRRPTRWQLSLAREADGWKVTEVTEVDPLSGERRDRHLRL